MTDDFATDGALAQAIKGFKPREPQRQMAQAVTEAINFKQELVVEAGTGTGKTFAYLAPALRADRKVIISTGSKALQDQLYARDLPTVAKALKYKGKLALLKGRSNYLCLERLEQQSMAGGELAGQTLIDLVQLRKWSSQTKEGDISTCSEVAEDSFVWPLVTSTNDNCTGSDCPLYQDCFVVKARRRAMDADVVVVNHHLFPGGYGGERGRFRRANPGSRGDDFRRGAPNPRHRQPVFRPAAHQPPTVGSGEGHHHRLPHRGARRRSTAKSADRLSLSTQDFRLNLGEPGFRGNLRDVLGEPNVQRALLLLDDALELCYDVMKLSLGRSALLDAAFERATLYRARLKRLKAVTEPGYSYWYECNSRHFVLALTPLTVADRFREMLDDKPGSWIFTSATLSVNDQLGHFTERLGLTKAKTLLLPSPFDYAKQALLCVPRFLPSPNQPGGARQLARMLRPLIEANNGRCFFLCTSHQMMRELAEEFRATMTLPVLLQGKPAKGSCSRSSSPPVTRCWWRPAASGKGWTCAATRCPASSSINCRLLHRTIRC